MGIKWRKDEWFDELYRHTKELDKVMCMTYHVEHYDRSLRMREFFQRPFRSRRIQRSIITEIIVIPVKVEKIPYDPLGNFIKISTYDDWKNRSFESTFHELDSITKGYQNLNLYMIEKILEGEKKRSGGKLQIFGATLPIVIVREWGVLIILLIQFYFLLHLKGFQSITETDKSYLKTPWIAPL